jgi:hypothetical protein
VPALRRAPGARSLSAVLGGRLLIGASSMRLVPAVALALALFVVSPASAHKPVKQATLGDLATVWVGGDAGGLEFFRLELAGDGTGLLTVQWLPDQPANAYKVLATRLSGYQVAFVLETVDGLEKSLYLRGTAYPSLLELEAGAHEPNWRRKLVLQPHSKLLTRLKAVSDRAAAFRTGL